MDSAIDVENYKPKQKVVVELRDPEVSEGATRVRPQRLLADNFTLAELRELGKWIKASDYTAFLSGLLSLRFGDFNESHIALIAEAIDEGIGENILDGTVGQKLKGLLTSA